MRGYGYARISRKSQSIDRQIRNIKAAYADAVILQEAFTDTKVEGRREFEKLLKVVSAGDECAARVCKTEEELLEDAGFQIEPTGVIR